MRVNYDIIIESYERANEELLAECYEIITEADTVDATSPAARNAASKNSQETTNAAINQQQGNQIAPNNKFLINLIQRINKIISTIITKIQEMSVKIMNRIKLLLESDKGFFTTLYKRKGMVKPLQGFRAITYQYRRRYLDSVVKAMYTYALSSIKQLANFTSVPSDEKIKQIIEADIGDVGITLVRFCTVEGQKITDVPQFIREMANNFRGEKKEREYNQSQLKEIEFNAAGKNAIQNECEQILTQCKNSVNVLRQMEAKARAQKSTEGLAYISRRVSKAVNIYNTLLSVVRMYSELRLEQALSNRILVKKFYQF